MSYWEERVRQSEDKALKEAATQSARQKALYARARKEIENELNDLLIDILTDKTPTRSQLWRAGKYLKLRAAIERMANEIADGQLDLMDVLLPEIYDKALKTNLEAMGMDYVLPSGTQVGRTLDTAWAGTNYSSRIWTNRDALAARLEKDISDLIVLGKNPTQIKKKLKDDLDVSYRAADRLIRTESAHIYTQASIDSYKKAGVKQVKYLHRGVCSGKCDCHSLDGQIFDIGTEPTLPRHPNCICCYVPVIDLTVAAKSDIVKYSEEQLDFFTTAFSKCGKAINPKKTTLTHTGKHADKRLAQRGITLEDAQHYIDSALICFQQSEDKTMFLSADGVVIVLENGGIATAYPSSLYDDNTKRLYEEVNRVWKKK